MKRMLLVGFLVIIVVGSIALGVTVKPCGRHMGEKMGGGTMSDTSILDVAPVQVLKVYMKGGDTE